MGEFIFKHKKLLAVIAGVFLLVLIIVSVIIKVEDDKNSAMVSVLITPSIAKVEIGNKVVKPIGEFRIRPGEYEVVVSADGFETKNTTLVAKENETVKLELFLEPLAENSNWYNTHDGDSLILGEINNNLTLAALDELMAANPILNELPIEIDYFTSDYSRRIHYTISYLLNDDNTNFSIIIKDYSGGNYDDAILRLKNNGADVEQLVIKYEDLSNDWLGGRAE